MSVSCLLVSFFLWRVENVIRRILYFGSTGPVDSEFNQDVIFLKLLDQFHGSTLHRRTNG